MALNTPSSSSSSSSLLLLHASGMSGAQFSRLSKAASAAGFDVVAPDLLGVGGTPLPPGPYSLQVEVEALVARLSSSPTPTHVFGHSFGGLVAIEAALKVPHCFASLCLYEPVIMVLAARHGSEGAKHEVARIDALMGISIADGGRAWVEAFIDWWNGPGFFASMPEAAKAPSVATALESHRQAGVVGDALITVDALSALSIPTLFLTGETSPASARESAQLAAAAMKNATVEVVAGAGHMGPLTHASAVNERVLQFFCANR
jgi:pimeloyl-ACP methyl ester carboxylesterase